MREFFIFAAADEKCTVKEDGIEATHEFTDILEAVTYVRQHRGEKEIKLTAYDALGAVMFTEII